MDVGVSAGAGMGWDPECVWNGFRLNYSVLCLFGGGGRETVNLLLVFGLGNMNKKYNLF